MSLYLRTAGALLFFCLLFSSSVRAYCIESWACIDTVESDDKVEIWARNAKPYDITVTVVAHTSNLALNGKVANRFDRTEVVSGFKRILMFTLKPNDPRRSHWFSKDFFWTPGNMHARHDNYMYMLPYAKGEYYRIVQGFGGGFSHSGASKYAVDFAMPVGTPIHASRDGVVIDLLATITEEAKPPLFQVCQFHHHFAQRRNHWRVLSPSQKWRSGRGWRSGVGWPAHWLLWEYRLLIASSPSLCCVSGQRIWKF